MAKAQLSSKTPKREVLLQKRQSLLDNRNPTSLEER